MSHSKYPLDCKQGSIENQSINGFKEDAIRVWGSDNKILFNTIDDSAGSNEHHRDAIQLIPTGKDVNSQYFGSIAKNNLIHGNMITSLYKLQCIFGSDGCQENLIIKDNILGTNGYHYISINGMLSGEITNNRTETGGYCPVVLEPLKIGGGLPDAFYVLSFKDHEYEPINTDQEIQDNRSSKLSRYPDANYVYDFDLNLFREIAESNKELYESVGQYLEICMAFYDFETNRDKYRPVDYPAIGKTTKRKITDISIHCSATKEGIDITTSDIRRWHVQDNGWNDIGYNYIIRLDGTIEKGRPLYKSPAAVKGHNKNMLAVCYIGGIDENQVAKDTRTPQQKASMDYLIGELKRHYPEATVKGHRSYPDVAKACPSFDATEEYR